MRAVLASLSFFLLCSCGASNSGTSGTAGAGGDVTSSGANGGSASTGGSGSVGGAASVGGASVGGGCNVGGSNVGGSNVGGGSAGGGIEACSDIGATECFSNYDCPNASDRCENQGTLKLPVACCVPGPRGNAGVGQACNGENDCKSSLCLDLGECHGVCTDICTNANECTATLPDCINLAFSGTDDKFCFPAE
jgi:hypothetical protein